MKVLLLDSSWQPVTVVSWQKAITLLLSNKAEIVEEYPNQEIRTVSSSFKMPSVLRIFVRKGYRKGKIPCSSSNVYFRDKYTCAYCGEKKNKSNLTLDHIFPVSKGGQNTWKNLITACFPCNQKKGARTPTEANMKLLFQPREPKWSLAFSLKLTNEDPIKYWSSYLFGLDRNIIEEGQ